jgi:phytoene dehydrogenase-like protein
VPSSPDAVVVGSGPNGLAAAVTMAAAGLRVQVIEGAPTIGGGCRTEELTLPGFWHDVCSAAHPLAVASPFFQRFDLAARGVTLARPEVEFAHPLGGGRAAVVTRSVAETAARLGADGPAYRRLIGPITDHMDEICPAFLAPLRKPPAHLLAVMDYGRRAILPASAVARRWRAQEARAILAGAAAHAMMPLTAVPTAGIGLMLIGLAHAVGWPVVAGGSARITNAMAAALTANGGSIETGRWVRSLAELPPAGATLLDVSPRALSLLAGDRLPGRYRAALRRFRYGPGVCKVDFALSGPVPWTSQACRLAGTLHLGGPFEQVAQAEAEVAAGKHPQNPYVLVVQPGVADPSRAPAGRQALWAYCHVPSGSCVDMTGRIEAQIERFAPGFRDLILARAVRTAADEEAHNPNYIGGDIGVGLLTLRQTILRPVPRWNPYRTPIRGVYLCSSATPPVPGVHGRCGEFAALTALRDVFGIRGLPDISPARFRSPVTVPLGSSPERHGPARAPGKRTARPSMGPNLPLRRTPATGNLRATRGPRTSRRTRRGGSRAAARRPPSAGLQRGKSPGERSGSPPASAES